MIHRNTMISLLTGFFLIGFLPVTRLCENPTRSDYQLKSDPEAVLVYAQVLSKRTDRFVEGLRREDFLIYDGGVKQVITDFRQEDLPVSIVLLLDVSGSMRYAVKLIKNVVTESLRPLKPEDEVSLIAFSETPRVVLPFTKDESLIKEKIEELDRTHGPTYEREALYFAATHLRTASKPAGCRIIIMITDNVSDNHIQPHSNKDVVKELLRSGVIVHGLIVPPNGPQRIDPRGFVTKGSINTYVEETGGLLLDLRDTEARFYIAKLIDNLHKRYTFRYEPSHLKRNRSHAEIKLKISPEVEKREGKLQVSVKLAP